MKKILLLIGLSFSVTLAFAQSSPTDSLKVLLRTAPNDSVKLDLILKLARKYKDFNWDTVVVYGEKALQIGIKQNNEELIFRSKGSLSEAYYNKGNYSKALTLAFQIFKFVESKNDKKPIASVLNHIGNIYKGQQNYKKAKQYYLQCHKLAKSINDTSTLVFSFGNLAYVYEKLDKLDSVLYYAKRFIAAPRVRGYEISAVYAVMGDVNLKLNNKKLANYYYNLAIRSAKASPNLRDLSNVSLSIAHYFRQINKIDSSVLYAHNALINGRKVSYNKSVYESAELLFNLYEDLKVPDSAFKYLKITSAAKEELYNVAKFQEIENITANEEERRKEMAEAKVAFENKLRFYLLGFLILVFMVGVILLWRNNQNRQKAYATLQAQKQETEAQKEVAESALQQLKITQTQLIQSEKMASLGELTAGIAHEIQNPLNFVNNFSEVSAELLEEVEEELQKGVTAEALALAADIKGNLVKINHHGKRADSIVKGMLEHSRTTSGKKELTDVNALADEYLRLSYHGLRAKNKSFNATLVTDFAPDLNKVAVVPQDLGRVLLNLFNNAFYAVQQKSQLALAGEEAPPYQPQVRVSTQNLGDKIQIQIRDNGMGIPENILNKIFQPFFTTKPTGEGTGLGLSLSYDIITKGHGGTMTTQTEDGQYAEFEILLPV